ncbi:MAG: hypothetical protein P1U36_01310 [Legionellaceae bacterium]|nr:hypothetical protein [Legionellaceae bacterium]
MPVKHYRIFDFDQTITQKHTLSTDKLTDINKKTPSSTFLNQGSEAAKCNTKTDIPSELFKLDSEHAFGIATYHNNPDYIAGYFQTILKTSITFTRVVEILDLVAINAYKIQGHEHPLLIAYIPEIGSDFISAVELLTENEGKNQHIELLQKVAFDQQYVDQDTCYDFFDDDEKNVSKAAELKNIRLNSHHVLRYKTSFIVADQEALGASLARVDCTSHHVDASLLSFILENPALTSGLAGLFVAVGLLATCALIAPPLGGAAILTAMGCGLFASTATYAHIHTPTTEPAIAM